MKLVAFLCVALFLIHSTVEARPVVVANPFGDTDNYDVPPFGLFNLPQANYPNRTASAIHPTSETEADMIHVHQKRANRLVLDVTLALLLSYFGLTVGGIILCCCWKKEVVEAYKSLEDGTSTTDPGIPTDSFSPSTQVVTTSRFYF